MSTKEHSIAVNFLLRFNSNMFALALILVLAVSLARLASGSLQIVPGATWTAKGTNQHVQAHGGGIIEVNGVYYWIGENKLNGSAFQSINCYSSTDLVQWTFVNELLTLQSSGDLGPNRVVERPHVIYNDASAKYVMWMHIDDSSYGEARAGVATCASVCGSYTYLGSSQPLGYQSRDMNVFKGRLRWSWIDLEGASADEVQRYGWDWIFADRRRKHHRKFTEPDN